MLAKGKRREPGAQQRDIGQKTTIAWQRVSVKVPSNWALTAVSGDDGAGVIRVERVSESESKFAPYGLDIRWSNKVKSSQTAEQLDKRIKPLIESARRAAKKNGKDCMPEIAAANNSLWPERGEIRQYSWNGSPAAYGRIWRCSECGRLLIAQIHGETESRFSSDARALLDSITCHNQTPGWSRWALYGIDVLVPDTFGLAKNQLMTIYVELRFGKLVNSVAQAVGETITIEQWSAASVQLKGQYIDEWIERKSSAMMASMSVDKGETQVNGHPALELTGRRNGLGYWLGDGVKAIKALKKPALNYYGIAWECPDSNKVYLIQNMTSLRSIELTAQIANNVLCHETLDVTG